MSQAKGMEGMPLPKKRPFSQLNPDPDCEYPTCNYSTYTVFILYLLLLMAYCGFRSFLIFAPMVKVLCVRPVHLVDKARTSPMLCKWEIHNSFILKQLRHLFSHEIATLYPIT